MSWVYIQSEPSLWTVGFYDPKGEWHCDSDHSVREEAAKRVHYLNGGAKENNQLRVGHNRGDAGRMSLKEMLALYTRPNCPDNCDDGKCPLNAIADGELEGQAFVQADGSPHKICTLFDYLAVNRPKVK